MRPKRKDLIEQAIVKTTKMLARENIKVTQRGAIAYCQWNKSGQVTCINIPVMPEDPTEEFLGALQGYIDHEVAHALLTNAVAQDKTMKRSPILSRGVPKSTLATMVNVIEDIRIERKITDVFPGAPANLNKLRQILIDTVWRGAAQTQNSPASIATLLIPYLRGLAGQKLCAEFCDMHNVRAHFTALHAVIPDVEHRLKTLETDNDVVSLAEAILMANEKLLRPETAPGPNDEREEKPAPKDTEEAPALPKDTEEAPALPSEAEEDHFDLGDDDDDDDAAEATNNNTEDGGDDDSDGDDSDGSDDNGDDNSNDNDGDDEDDGKSGVGNVFLEAALKRLKPLQRRALFLYNNKKKSVAYIASDLNISVPDAEKTLLEARRKLNKLMKGGK